MRICPSTGADSHANSSCYVRYSRKRERRKVRGEDGGGMENQNKKISTVVSWDIGPYQED
jgi:hypothetical protein